MINRPILSDKMAGNENKTVLEWLETMEEDEETSEEIHGNNEIKEEEETSKKNHVYVQIKEEVEANPRHPYWRKSGNTYSDEDFIAARKDFKYACRKAKNGAWKDLSEDCDDPKKVAALAKLLRTEISPDLGLLVREGKTPGRLISPWTLWKGRGSRRVWSAMRSR